MENAIVKIISNKLFETFYVDELKYGKQQDDGSYKLIKGKITPVTIQNMINKQESLLTYQELHVVDTALVKWICIDLDISKREIDNNDVNADNLRAVKKTADVISGFLDSVHISHLMEFSGRRGFHIWVIFDCLITKEDAYYFINYIYSNVKDNFEDNIIADLFPKIPFVNRNSKGIGYGIKLPLSQNKGSGKLSFFLNKNENFDVIQSNWIEKANPEFLQKQLEILKEVDFVTSEKIELLTKKYKEKKPYLQSISRSRKVVSTLLENISLDDILTSLRKCENLNVILKDFEKGLGNKERGILVGLLGQLKTPNNPEFGKNILLELFSKIKGFNKEITLKKLETYKYFKPITCRSLGNCSFCKEQSINSPVELIDGILLQLLPSFTIQNIDRDIFNKIQLSLLNYSMKNDEVPLYSQLEAIKHLEFEEINKYISDIYNNKLLLKVDSFKFQRNEVTKIRNLYNIDPINNFVSVYFTFVLNNLFFSEISNNSYGYEFSPSFYKHNIFNNWFYNWAKYTRSIENVLFGIEYEEYFVLKVDIKSFYDKIDLKRLKIKLFEEAPIGIKMKLDELDEESVDNYKSIIDFQIELASKTTDENKKGLPQGPAFARYLAEIYLLGLDDLIENKFIKDQKREFYNRFVDDVFIFVESEERAKDLFKNIKGWLSINGLELNDHKTKIVNVKEYKDSGEYHKFKDDVKYDINHANKNKSLLSEIEIQEAISKLETLTEDVKFGLKDNLRFFYNNFKDSNRLNFIRKKMADVLPFSDNGRGTLYLIFYSNLLSNFPNQFWNISNKINKVNGLSLTHYLNTILLNEEILTTRLNEIDSLIKSVYLKEDLTEADKLLIVILKFKTNNQTDLNYSDKIMNAALQTPGLKFGIENWATIEEELRVLDDLDFLVQLNQIIIKQDFTKEFLNELADYSFVRFSEWKSSNKDFINQELVLRLYYQNITFLTLFCESEYSNVGPSWELLLDVSIKIGQLSDNKHKFNWIDKIESFSYTDFSKNSYTLILSNKAGSSLGNSSCENEFLDQYRNLLIVLLFNKDKAAGSVHFQKDVLENIDSENSLFFQWVSNPNANLYPDLQEDVCLKNIALNGIIVLKNENKFFVKNIYQSITIDNYNYLNIDPKYSDKNEIEYDVPSTRIKDALKKPNFIEFIKSLSEVVTSHEGFRKDYRSNYPYFYRPFDCIGSLPAVPFYSDALSVVNSVGEIVELNISSYWKGLLDVMKISEIANIKLEESSSKFNFKVKDINERFFPVSPLIIDSDESKINFIKLFAKNINSDIKTIFQYQYNWCSTVLILCGELKNSNDLIINYLKIHFETYDGNNVAEDLLFSVDETLAPKKDSLEEFFNTILSSVNIFQNQVHLGKFDILEIITTYILDKLEVNSAEHLPVNKSELINSTVHIKKSDDPFTKKSTFALYINDQEYNTDNAFLFDHYSQKFQLESLEDLSDKIKGTEYFVAKNKATVFIYAPELEFVKCYERINIRKNTLYDKLYSHVEDLPPNNEEYLSLFPFNSRYTNIKNIVEGSGKLEIIKEKLGIHLKASFNITNRIINWLLLFNEETTDGSNLKKYMDENGIEFPTLYESILSVLANHSSVSQNHIDFFKEKIGDYNVDSNAILLPIKDSLSDANGLKRLFDKSGFHDRDFNWQKQFDNLCGDHSFKELVIITDVAISGSQTKKAFDYYLKSDHKDKDQLLEFNETKPGKRKSPKEEKYFLFTTLEKCEKFKSNISQFEKLLFVSPLMTQKFKENIEDYFKSINPHLSFEYEGEILAEEFYEFGKCKMNNVHRALFKTLVNDVELINKLFDYGIKYNENYYKRSLEEFDKTNLILRIQSLPSKHIRLFSLKPRRGGTSLLDYIDNW
ncbi:Reverse transcriptase (RNA-dependent DNA polymerase) [Kaistella chaponensis]|uniref:Reverse transcriptase (RNA-dependent DNA polymerase) n=1 Tax=Kaistella chaponensis TaxID=713588 RepID=A0A1N7MF41_9FLAO|nr:reverse transcriptase domain-containing protein [Kaistella chaponensis]SIS84640.1 Reverse transcriptase (RNA-dependent DNA polymerase) [Kaistella chaponensis]